MSSGLSYHNIDMHEVELEFAYSDASGEIYTISLSDNTRDEVLMERLFMHSSNRNIFDRAMNNGIQTS
jgi:hypothetical protein